MAVVTESFDIPMDIMTKLAIGEYRRIGGVVRVAIGPNKGQIVKHLEPVKMEQADQIQKVGSKIMQVAKNRKKRTYYWGFSYRDYYSRWCSVS